MAGNNAADKRAEIKMYFLGIQRRTIMDIELTLEDETRRLKGLNTRLEELAGWIEYLEEKPVSKDKQEILQYFSGMLDGYLELRRTSSWRKTALDKECQDRKINKLTRWVKWLKGEDDSV